MKKEFSHEGLKKTEVDAMPRVVAVEMLTDSRARLTNRMRKNCLAALSKFFHSTALRKPVAGKIERKLESRPIAWIVRELRRASKQRRGFQIAYEAALRVEPKNPVIGARIALLNVRVAHLDLFIEAAEDEISWRKSRVAGVYRPVGLYWFQPMQTDSHKHKWFPRWRKSVLCSQT